MTGLMNSNEGGLMRMTGFEQFLYHQGDLWLALIVFMGISFVVVNALVKRD